MVRENADFEPASKQLLALAAVLSFCSLIYEMTIASCFVGFTGDAPFWQSATIGLYLAGVGLGTWACSRWVNSDPWEWLWRVELLLCAVGATGAIGLLTLESAFWIRQHFYLQTPPSAAGFLWAVGTGHALTLLIGILSGFELPLLIRMAKAASSDGRDRTRDILAANYAGALAGGLAFSLWLLPAFDATGAAAFASAVNLAVCVFLYKSRRPELYRTAQLAGAALCWLLCLAVAPLVGRLNALSFYARRFNLPYELQASTCCSPTASSLGPVLRALWRRRGDAERLPSRVQRVELLDMEFGTSDFWNHFNRRPSAEPGLSYGLSLYLDRKFQFSGASEAIYHEYLAHVPVQLFRRLPAEALILGGGDGLLAKELLKYGEQIRSIVNVELDPAMAELAREEPRLRRLNGEAFEDPKVEVVVADAFSYVRTAGRRFDAIYIDFPFPYNYDAAKLYTAEFFRNVAGLLKPGGFVVMDYPLASEELLARELGPEGLRRNSIAVNTLKAAGFNTIVPYDTEAPELMRRSLAMNLGVQEESVESDSEIGRLQRRIEARRFLLRHPNLKADDTDDLVVVRNEVSRESMLAFVLDRTAPNFLFEDLGIPLYALNASRLLTLEGGRFPYQEDKKLINRVVRPTLFRSLRPLERD